jgi:sortase (surface protein transpeptidase)
LFKSALGDEHFNEIILACQTVGNEIWTAISGLQNNAKGNETAYTERAKRINANLRLRKAGDDSWKNAVHSWAEGQESRHEYLAVHV